jgi:LPS O-antigen subunit length determinant protein (WzzB/FepE family)
MNKNFDNDYINIISIFSLIWRKKFVVAFTTFLFGIFSILYVISIQNIYTSKSVLAPMTSNQSMSSNFGSLSSLANLSGFAMPSNSNMKTQEGIERIKSFEFFDKYFLPHVKIENLINLKKWNKQTNSFTYSENIESSSGIRLHKAHQSYLDALSITKISGTSFITITIKHKSPYIAKKWLEIIIEKINFSMREEDKKIAENSIIYLNEISSQTKIQSIKEAISGLVEEQMNILMLANANEAYVFKIIDPPLASEIKSEPNRTLICILITLMGFMVSVVFVLFFYSDDSEEAVD